MRVRASILGLVGLVGCGRARFDAIASDGRPDNGVTAGLIGWWKLDETSGTSAADSSGNGLDGTLFNSPTWLPTGGKLGGALSFGSTFPFVSVGNSVTFANLSALTASAWIQTSTLPAPGEHCIFDKGDLSGAGWHLQVSTWSAGDVSFRDGFSGNDVTRISNPALSAGAWQHVAATWDGGISAAGIHLYVDGIETGYADTSDGTGTRADDASNDLAIDCESASQTLEAVLDDVRIYDRVLSPAEVAAW